MAARSIPHYTPKSKVLVMGRFGVIANYFRRVLVEDIYGRLSEPAARHTVVRKTVITDGHFSTGIMFPEGRAWQAPADE